MNIEYILIYNSNKSWNIKLVFPTTMYTNYLTLLNYVILLLLKCTYKLLFISRYQY